MTGTLATVAAAGAEGGVLAPEPRQPVPQP